MAKKKKSNILIIVSLILVLIGGIFLFTQIVDIFPEGIIGQVPSDCKLTTSGEQTGLFTCSKDTCTVQGWGSCETPTSALLVLLRVSSKDVFPSELAVDPTGSSGILLAYKSNSGVTAGNVPACSTKSSQAISSLPAPNQINFIYNENGVIKICDVLKNQIKTYSSGGSVPTIITPLEPYKSEGREIYQGEANIYSCVFDLKINNVIVDSFIYYCTPGFLPAW